MLTKSRFRFPEVLLGIFLAVALFAIGVSFSSSQHQINNDTPAKEDRSAQTERIVQTADDRIADYTLALDVLTFVLAIATIGLGFIGWIGIRNQTNDTRILQRAYLVVDGGGVLPLTGHTDSVAEIGVKNVGNLPARNVSWFIDVDVDPSGRRTEFPIDASKFFGGTNVIPPGTEMKRSQYFQRTKGEIFTPSGKSLYVWGEIRYTDGFGEPRFTKFCHRYPVSQTRGIGSRNGILAEDMRYHRYGNDAD